MPIAIIVLDETNNILDTIATIIKKDLQFTDQFAVSIEKLNPQTIKKQLSKIMKKLCTAGTPLALCINNNSPNTIEWRLYDTMQLSMIAGKKSQQKNIVMRGWAHAIADNLWKTLTNNDGFFSSRLAYCKDSKNDKGHTIRKVYITDFDGSNEELLVDLPTITIAPRWHVKKPRLFYSEYADTNVRLVSISMNKKRKTISSFDGINMLANFAQDGKTVVYCSSRGDGSCQLYYYKNGKLKRFTNNTGNNVSPIFLDDTRICFCSDYQTGSPQIYIGNIETGHLQRITKGGYCTSPSYCPKTDMLVYHMMVKGTMQLFTYNFTTKEHKQLTTTAGNKHEASWSPCGTQLLFAQEEKNSSRLVVLNVLTKKTKYLTSTNEQCSYPHWGPCYPVFPVVA
jgi:TolB protein